MDERWGWMFYDNPSEAMPMLDDKQHCFGTECWCKPKLVDGCLAHNAADGREAYEQGLRKKH